MNLKKRFTAGTDPKWIFCALALSVLLVPGITLGASPDSQVLTTVAPSPLNISVNPDGKLLIDAGQGKALQECRAYLASRRVGADAWQEEYSSYKVLEQKPQQLVLEAQFSKFKASITLHRDSVGRYELSGQLVSKTEQAMEVARFHYLDGLIADPAMNLLSMRQFELPGGIIKSSQKLRSPRAVVEANWGSNGVTWPRLAEPIHDQADVAISGDTGMLGTDWNTPGFFIGFTGPGSAFGELGMRTAREKPSFYAAVLLDGVRVEPGKTRVLENAILSYGDPQDELRHWAIACRDILGPVRVRPPLVGYCSWYQKSTHVQPADIRRAIAGFASYDAPPGGRTIQIDDGYQVRPGDWNGRGEWLTELKKLPGEMSDKGFIPGIWIAPTAIQSSDPIVKEHPEWLQRDAKGGFCVKFSNWGPTYFLEPDHPEARKHIVEILHQLRADGWRYFKIDFAYTVSSSRVKYDPHKTTHESLRDQWRLFREALGDDAIINACVGGILRYTLGSMDISRIGGDIGGNMNTVRKNLAEMMLRSHVNGLWYQVDPDVFYMRGEDSQLNFEQSHLLTATEGLLGTAFLTSDFSDQWSPEASAVVRRYWNKAGPHVPLMQYLVLRPDGLPAALSAAYGKGEYAVGVYNWSKDAGDITISLKELRMPEGVKYAATSATVNSEKITLTEGILTIFQQPGESIRIIKLRAEPSH